MPSPVFGPDGPQGLINADLDEGDVVILIAWNRMNPGTAEALEQALARWEAAGGPALLPYFSEEASVLKTEAECYERIEVLKARAMLEDRGLRSFTDVHDFERQLEDDLLAVIRAKAEQPPAQPTAANTDPMVNNDEEDPVSQLMMLSRQMMSN